MILAIVLAGIGVATGDADLEAMLPGEVDGWTPKEEDGHYTADDLFDYINGSAEIYRSFNVRRVLARYYTKDGGPDIAADVFDMGRAPDAYGAYHHDLREGAGAGLGQESEFFGGSLAFWKDRFVVALMATEDTEEARAAMMAIAKNAADAIPSEGKPPALLGLLPAQGRVANQTKYFHNHLCLNLYHYVADENILGLGPRTEGVLARYTPADADGSPAKSAALAAIRYPSGEEAAKAKARFLWAHLPDADMDGLAHAANGRWAGARLDGDVMALVFDASARGDADHLLGRVLDAKRNTCGAMKDPSNE